MRELLEGDASREKETRGRRMRTEGRRREVRET